MTGFVRPQGESLLREGVRYGVTSNHFGARLLTSEHLRLADDRWDDIERTLRQICDLHFDRHLIRDASLEGIYEISVV
jgi:hypothetical protein